MLLLPGSRMADEDEELKLPCLSDPTSGEWYPNDAIPACQTENECQSDGLITTTSTSDPRPLTEPAPSVPRVESLGKIDEDSDRIKGQATDEIDEEASPRAYAQAVLDDPKASTARIEEAITHLQKAIFFEPLNIK